jgi:hypothetical protein
MRKFVPWIKNYSFIFYSKFLGLEKVNLGKIQFNPDLKFKCQTSFSFFLSASPTWQPLPLSLLRWTPPHMCSQTDMSNGAARHRSLRPAPCPVSRHGAQTTPAPSPSTTATVWATLVTRVAFLAGNLNERSPSSLLHGEICPDYLSSPPLQIDRPNDPHPLLRSCRSSASYRRPLRGPHHHWAPPRELPHHHPITSMSLNPHNLARQAPLPPIVPYL